MCVCQRLTECLADPIGVKIPQKVHRIFSNRQSGMYGEHERYVDRRRIRRSYTVKNEIVANYSIAPDTLLNGVRAFHDDETKRVDGKVFDFIFRPPSVCRNRVPPQSDVGYARRQRIIARIQFRIFLAPENFARARLLRRPTPFLPAAF